MDRACGKDGTENANRVLMGNPERNLYLEDPDVEGRMIIKFHLKVSDGKECNAYIWQVVCPYDHGNEFWFP
jgi:hypothetical protein